MLLKNKKIRNTLIKFAFLTALVSIVISYGQIAQAGSTNRLMVLSIDADTPCSIGDQCGSTGYSLEPSYSSDGGYFFSWIKQVSPNSDAFKVRVGGDRMIALLNDGTVLTKDSIYENWVTQTTGARDIAIGANSQMMIVNSAGDVYSKLGLYDSWVQQTSGGNARSIAVGGNGRLMVVDSAYNAYSKDSTYDSWTKQVDGALYVVVGRTGQMGVINIVGNAYSKFNRTEAWVQQTGGGGTKDFSIGGNGRMMVIDSANNAYSKESTYASWVMQVSGAFSVGVGSTGRMVVVNSNWEVYYKDLPTTEWNLIYRSNYPGKNYSYSVVIN